jgi:hypothetical protein
MTMSIIGINSSANGRNNWKYRETRWGIRVKQVENEGRIEE